MSLINDALKQARQTPPRNPPNSPLPLRPVVEEPASIATWLIPAIVIILIITAIFFIGWASASRAVNNIVAAPDPVADTPAAERVVPASAPVPKVVEPPPITPPDAPVLQGIFYSPTRPSAILDGKTYGLGDQCRQYQVKAIGKFIVTLVGPDKKEIKLSMNR
jgi:hypothetical protein